MCRFADRMSVVQNAFNDTFCGFCGHRWKGSFAYYRNYGVRVTNVGNRGADKMILQALAFTKLAAPFDTPSGGAWDDQITYNFTKDPAYGDAAYVEGYPDR